MPSQLHVSGQCTEAHGSAPGKTFQQSLRNAAAEARRGDHGIMYGRAFLIQKLIQGRPARNQTILKSSIMCMGEHFFFRTALLVDSAVYYSQYTTQYLVHVPGYGTVLPVL